MNSKIMLAVAVTSLIVAVGLAPTLMTSANAARDTTCTNGGGQTKECGSPPAKCETVKAGQGQGGGEIKSTTCP
ncbi:MAG TPA: hypothetical protein VE818_07400 [Nitrososphaeraceae archaeon]|nr:hypothetical protein [Nitrososphaeraceae archaeon]